MQINARFYITDRIYVLVPRSPASRTIVASISCLLLPLPPSLPLSRGINLLVLHLALYVCVYIYIYIYARTERNTHTRGGTRTTARAESLETHLTAGDATVRRPQSRQHHAERLNDKFPKQAATTRPPLIHPLCTRLPSVYPLEASWKPATLRSLSPLRLVIWIQSPSTFVSCNLFLIHPPANV